MSCVVDLPLFVDPFLLFTSKKPEYQALHDEIINYLRFLRDKAVAGDINDGLLKAWFCFPEVHQNKFGFCLTGSRGSGLGMGFARALHGNLTKLFTNFGTEQITKGSHLEKLVLIRERVGRDNISDFTTNLIKGFFSANTRRSSRWPILLQNCAAVFVSRKSASTMKSKPGRMEPTNSRGWMAISCS